MSRIGGETPLVPDIHTISLEAPTGTSSSQVCLPGEIYKIDGTAADGVSQGYKAAACASGDDPTNAVLVSPLHRIAEVGPVSGWIIIAGNLSQIRRLKYKSGSAPTVGQSIEASTDLKTVVGKAFDGRTFVCYVDTAALEVEVLC